jgi:ERCC4-type nuclease
MSQAKPKVETEVAQVYQVREDGPVYQVVYVDDQIVLMRSSDTGRKGNNTHRIEGRKGFENQRDSGWFEYLPDSDVDLLSFEEQDWSEVPYIGQQTAENLVEAGYETILDIQKADDGDLLEVDGVGNGGAENLREFSQ